MRFANKENYMSTKTNDPSIKPITEEIKDQNSKYNLSKFDFDLYHEEDDIINKIIRVKRISLPNKGERWKIMENNKVMLLIEGTKLTNKEKEFLRSVDGINFLMNLYKEGLSSFNALKKELKKKLK